MDNLEHHILLDELADQAELFGYLNPIEYARLRSVRPQLVYYRIRTGKLEYKPCPCCGRKVISVRDADRTFGRVPSEEEVQETSEEDTGGGVQPTGNNPTGGDLV